MTGILMTSCLYGETLSNALINGEWSGEIRGAYVFYDNAEDVDNYATAIGAQIRYETAPWNHVRLGFAPYMSKKIAFASGDGDSMNYDFLSNETDSYIYLGERYLDYTYDGLNVRIGRQQFDSPFADTDDIRHHPNTFEAAIVSYTPREGMNLIGGYLRRWAGFDSGDDISNFKRLDGAGSNGAYLLGLMDESVENLTFQGWFYGVDRVADALYTDAAYTIALYDDTQIQLSAQYAAFNERNGSGIDGKVAGADIQIGSCGLNVDIAYNRAFNPAGSSVTNGFGGGPYFTSMEEMTIDGMNDAEAWRIGLDANAEKFGIKGLNVRVAYGEFKSGPDHTKQSEYDVVAAYEITGSLLADISYAHINDHNNNTGESGGDGGYSRFLARVRYNF